MWRLFRFSLRVGVLVALALVVKKVLDQGSDTSASESLRNLEPSPTPKPDPVSEPELVANREEEPAEIATSSVEVEVEPVAIEEEAPPKPARGAMVTWVKPLDGVCPTSHPIKAKLGSKVYRRPDMPGYDNSKPERCYASEGAARRDGFTAAQR